MTRHLVWFRSDLRVHDNIALNVACSNKEAEVVAIYFITPKQWREHDWGDPKISFVLRTIEKLKEKLSNLSISLNIYKVDYFKFIPEKLTQLCIENNIDTVFANYEYELNERNRDILVKRKLDSINVSFKLFHDQCCLAPNHPDLKTGQGSPYSVFTPFKKRFIHIVEQQGGIKDLGIPEKRIKKSIDIFNDSLNIKELSSDDELPSLELFKSLWQGGEEEALKRLNSFVDNDIQNYAKNRDFPNLDTGTSKVSPYLAVGALSVRVAMLKAIEANGDLLAFEKNGAMTWASELIWREFYRHVLLYNDRLCMYQAYKPDVDKVAWRYDENDFDKWKKGLTGYPFVDAAMRQLAATGWMHNRLRMVVAMFLTKHLLIDWRWGEKYFMQSLVDADLASNNGGWQWSASTGTDAQPYFRIFNPYSQSEKFDPDGEFIRKYLPELKEVKGKSIHKPPMGIKDYPAPIIDQSEGRNRALQAFKRD